jgi:hypothetical protein
MSTPEKLHQVAWLFHFTDKRNLASIKAMGGLYSMLKLQHLATPNVCTGGNQWSLSADEMFGMNRYVHLCFRKKHPLEYLARQRGQIGETLWLQIDAQSIFKIKGVLFTPDVSNKAGVSTYSLNEAAEKIDYGVLYSNRDLRDHSVLDRLKAAERCEVLVPDFLPIKLFERHLPHG